MKEDEKSEAEILRQQAEESMNQNAINLSTSFGGSTPTQQLTNRSQTEMLKLIHELEVHQVELEMQNKELRRTRLIADAAISRYTELYDFAPSGYFSLSEEGNMLELNLTAAVMLGKDRSKLINSRFAVHVSPETCPVFNLFLEKAFQNTVKQTCEIVMLKDGEMPMDVLLTGIVSENGEHCNVTVVDITESKQAKVALRESNEFNALLLQTIPFGMDIVDEFGNILFVDDAMQQLVGEQLQGKKCWEMYRDDKRQCSNCPLHGGVEIGETKTIETQGVLGGRYFEIYHTGIMYKGKKAMLEAFIDITERKQAEKSLQESKKYLDRIINTVASPLFVKDSNHKFCLVNDALCSLLSMPSEDLIGATGYEIFPEEQMKVFLAKDEEVFTTGKENINEEFITNGKGNIRTVITRKTLYTDPDGNKFLVGVINDITESKQAELVLQESEEKFRSITEQTNDLISISDSRGIITYASSASKTLFQYSPEEMCGHNFIDFVDEPEIPRALAVFRDTIENDTGKRNHEFTLKRKDGSLFIGEMNGTKFQQGLTNRTLVVIRDITERKLAETVLYESREKYHKLSLLKKAILESPQGIIVFALDINYCYLDFTLLHKQTMKAIWGAEIEKGSNMLSFISNEIDREKAKANFDKVLVGEQFVLTEEYGDENLTRAYYEDRYSPIFDENNTIIGLSVFVIDITERKLAEEKIRQKDLQFRKLSANLPDLIFQFTRRPDGTYHVPIASEGIKNIFGCSPEDVIDDFAPIGNVIFPDDAEMVINAIEYSAEHLTYFTCEFRVQIPGKPIQWIFSRSSPEKLPDGSITWYGFNADITERKHVELELIAAKEHAEESDRLKSAFLANMSHEIRTPMNGILGFASLLKQPDLSGDEQQEFIGIIEKSGARMLNIINDIVDISKIEAGLMTLNIKESNINEQVEYMYTFFKPEVEAKGMKLFFNTTLLSKEAIISTDREKLYAVLTNLIKNAIKYSEKGIIEFGYNLVQTRHALSPIADTDTRHALYLLQFYVKDMGIGIPKDRQSAIFERFIQADISDTRAFQGAGLGLSISKAYLEMLGGEIWVESEEGEGSTFYFTLPYNTQTEDKKDSQAIAAGTQPNTPVSGLKILIAEDDETSEKLIGIIVKMFGKEIVKVRSGTETVEVARNNPDIDLILMDIQMPEMGGYEATQQIRGFNKDVVIIAQTAYGLTGDREKALAAGCNDYIAKPIDRDELIKLIKKHLKR